MEQAVESEAQYLKSHRRFEISSIVYEMSSPEYQRRHWVGIGGDEEGFSAAYDLIVTEYDIPDDVRQIDNLGLNRRQWSLLCDLAVSMRLAVKLLGYSHDNAGYVGSEGWSEIVSKSRFVFISLNSEY